MGIRPDQAGLADMRMAFEARIGQNRGVHANRDTFFDPGRSRVHDGDPVDHVAVQNALVQDMHGLLKLAPVIDAQDLLEIEGASANCETVLDQDLNRVSQVIFFLVIAAADPPQYRQQFCRVKAVHAGIDFTHGALLFTGIAMLNDPFDMALAVADDAAIASRIRRQCRHDNPGIGALLKLRKDAAQGFTGDQGGIAANNQRHAIAAFEEMGGLQYGVPSAQLLFLQDEGDGFA